MLVSSEERAFRAAIDAQVAARPGLFGDISESQLAATAGVMAMLAALHPYAREANARLERYGLSSQHAQAREHASALTAGLIAAAFPPGDPARPRMVELYSDAGSAQLAQLVAASAFSLGYALALADDARWHARHDDHDLS